LKQKAADPENVAGVGLLAERVDGLSPQEMRELADNLRGKLRSGVVVLGRAAGGKVSLLVAVTADLKQRVPARDLVKELGPMIGGGGGGRPDMAEAGGKNEAGLDDALAAARGAVERFLEADTG
jgi:alanyl-tRNA synthetase